MSKLRNRVSALLLCAVMVFSFSAQAASAQEHSDDQEQQVTVDGVFSDETRPNDVDPDGGDDSAGVDTIQGDPVDPIDISDATLRVIGDPFVYTGEPIEPEVEVKLNDTVLTRDEDYTVSYSNNINVSSVGPWVTVTGIGAYTGEIWSFFSLQKAYRDGPPKPNVIVVPGSYVALYPEEGVQYWISFDIGAWLTFHENDGYPVIFDMEGVPEGFYSIEASYPETENYHRSDSSEAFLFDWEPSHETTAGFIPRPADVRFDGAVLRWRMVAPEDAPDDWDCMYRVEIEYEDIDNPHLRVAYIQVDMLGQDKYAIIGEYFNRNGTYTIRVSGSDLYGEYPGSEYTEIKFQYTKPAESLAAPTDLWWSIEGGEVYVNFTHTNDEEDLSSEWDYLLEVFKEDGEYAEYQHYGAATQPGEAKSKIWSYLLADGTYKFRVRMLSGDVNKKANSDWSEWSDTLRIGDSISIGDELSDIAQKLRDGEITAAETLQLLKDLDQGELWLALHNDPELRAMIAAIEAEYMSQMDITSSTSVSTYISDKLDGDVSVVGAGFSSSGGDVTLNFENKKEDVEIESRYVNHVQFSIELDGANSSELDIPIRITMPIPKPLSSNRLVIMHYTQAGTYEEVNFINNGDGTISFTITHLSEFVFAEEADSEDIISFADPAFKAALLEIDGIDANGDGEISVNEASMVDYINVNGKGIHSLAGIEYFVSLNRLYCSSNLLTELDLSALEQLTHLTCAINSLTNLDLTANSNLQSLSCNNNPLYSIDVSHLVALRELDVSNCQLSSLNIATLVNLEELTCSFNQLTELHLANYPRFNFLDCRNNQITALDLSGVPSVEFVFMQQNRIADLNLTGLSTLRALFCEDNLLTGIDATNLDSLTTLSCRYNYIADISDVVGYTSTPDTWFYPQYTLTPTAPRNLTAIAGDGEVQLHWEAPEDARGNEILNYRITVGTSSIYGEADYSQGNVLTHTVTGLDNDVEHIFYVRANTEAGYGAYAAVSATPEPVRTSIENAEVSITGRYTYTGSEITPPPESVSVKLDGTTLRHDDDYTYRLSDGGIQVGEATITITGKNAYMGTKDVTFTIEKALQGAPSAPELASKTADKVVLAEVPGTEFRCGDLGAWQASPEFTGLVPNTSYIFYARLKETDTHEVSPASQGLTVVTSQPMLGGYVSINGLAKFGELLTANTSSLDTIPVGQLGALSYQWKRGGTNIPSATSSTYTLVAADIGETITVTVTAANCEGEVTSPATAAVDKADAPATPAAPTMASRTENSITLETITGAEYRRGASGVWQDSPTFTGLSANTGYTFYARIKETTTRYGSAVSAESATITTLKAPQAAPGAPTLANKTADSVTLNTISGAEYRQGTTGTWQDSPTFTGLTPNTAYSFYARLKETATHEASAASSAFTVTTDKSVLGGTVAITGTAKFGEELAGETSGLTSTPDGALGSLSYQWKRDGTNITNATSNTYTLVEADIGSTITVTVTAANCSGNVTSAATAVVEKADGPAAPEAPTSVERTEDSITLDEIAGAEYRMGASGAWQDSPSFTGLAGNTGYTFFARIKETATHKESAVSAESATITTLKAFQAPPATPTLRSKTADSVTLNVIAGAEYRQGANGAWQDSPAFSSLTPNTEYSFYARMKETVTHEASLASEAFTVTTDKSVLGGTVAINGTVKLGEELAAETSGLTSTPTGALGSLSYQWKRDGSNITGATSSTYTLVEADIGSTITVTVNAANCTGDITSPVTATVEKADGPAAPAVTGTYTGNGISFTYKVNAIPGAEYSTDGSSWQDSNTFTGYSENDSVTFYARIKETATHEAGAVGNTGVVQFVKLDDRAAPALSYTISADRTTITITEVEGAEYRFGDDGWSTTNSKGGYTGTETVIIQIRLAMTDTHVPSAANMVSVNLQKADQAAPGAFTMTYTYDSGTGEFTVTIPKVAGGEYSFDGTTYSATNTTTAAPGAFVTGYVRLAETDDKNASPATTSSITLPYPATSVTVSAAGNKNTITDKAGTLQLYAAVQPVEASQAVTWSVSSGGSFATISNSGLLTAKANGTVTVRATTKDGTDVYGEMNVTISGQGESTVKPTDPVQMSGVPEGNQIQVGKSFTLTPQGVNDTYTGSTGWTWDEAYFSATFNNPATFTALKAGTSTITYTAADGRVWSLTLTILAADDGSSSSTSIDAIAATGDNANILLWVILAAVSLGAVTVLVVRRRQKAKARK